MKAHFDDLEREVSLLRLKPKAALARLLIEGLGTVVEADAEQLWNDEAQRRYDSYLKGELQAIQGAIQ